jgi:hypothetical protein
MKYSILTLVLAGFLAGFLATPVLAQDLSGYSARYAYDDASRMTQFTVNGAFTHRFDYGDGGAIQRYVVGPTASVDVEPVQDDALPRRVALHEAYPNPFNPSTSVRFDLPATASVSVEVFDLLGRSVARLVDGTLPAGFHQVSWDASGAGSGTYLVRMRTGSKVMSRTVVLVK